MEPFNSDLLLSILLQGDSGGAGGSTWVKFLPWILILVVFYFFMIRPQMKKAKKEREFRENLQKDDQVVTIGGIHGKVHEIKDSSVILGLEDGTRIRVEKNAISANSSTQLSEDQKS
jgi:preprotein translocase subunit YajC